MTSYSDDEPEAPHGWSPLAVALIATLVLLLGLGGALFGIHVANTNADAKPDVTVGIPSRTVDAPPSTTPAASPTPSPSATPTAEPPAGTFPLPDLAGADFQSARAKIRELKLGWRLVFEGEGEDVGVRATEPVAGALVKRGATVKIYVKGAAPLATVPGVTGLACDDAASIIVEQGLYPRYVSGRTGVVTNQLPNSSDPQTLRWNDVVELTCA